MRYCPSILKRFYGGSTSIPNSSNFEALLTDAALVSDEELERMKAMVRAKDPDMMLFTSGSSGRPKGVVQTHFARVNNARFQAQALSADHNDRFCCALPLFHCFSLSAVVLPALAVGACVCFPENHHTISVLHTIERYRCTVLMGVPTMFSAILARPDLDGYDLRSLRIGLIAGSSYPPTLFEKIVQRLKFALLPALGMTEATAGITCGAQSDSMYVRTHSVGKFLPYVEGKICDIATGEALPEGRKGELCIRGYCVMDGYYHNTELTRQVIDLEGWFHTGDLGYMDSEENLYIIGRLKDLIIRGGENISPLEVESAIATDPRIECVKVVGVPDPHYIEEICACVISKSPITTEEIRRLVQRQLARYKIPRYILFFSELPRTPSGKLDGRKIRTLALKSIALESNA